MGRDDASPNASETPQQHFLTTEEVAARYRTSPATVRWWRQIGTYGPKGIKVGRRVLYSMQSCQEFERQMQAQEKQASA